jgi:mannose-6-phosphate isomerase
MSAAPSFDSAERPWGSWHVLDEGAGFKVKRIVVLPHQRLSYQTHEHRAEHWVVVSGKATCVIDGTEVLLGPGESVDVAIGQPHRICNAEDEALVLVEVQLGDYTGEDDIVRLEDDYDRCG